MAQRVASNPVFMARALRMCFGVRHRCNTASAITWGIDDMTTTKKRNPVTALWACKTRGNGIGRHKIAVLFDSTDLIARDIARRTVGIIRRKIGATEKTPEIWFGRFDSMTTEKRGEYTVLSDGPGFAHSGPTKHRCAGRFVVIRNDINPDS